MDCGWVIVGFASVSETAGSDRLPADGAAVVVVDASLSAAVPRVSASSVHASATTSPVKIPTPQTRWAVETHAVVVVAASAPMPTWIG